MNEIVNKQVLLFITSVQIGILMGALFDMIRIFRVMIKHPNFLVQVEDLLFWVVCGFISFYLLYICNYADIRPFIFLGIILGGGLYLCSFSLIFMKVMTKIILYVKVQLRKLLTWLMKPIKCILRLLSRPIKWGQVRLSMFRFYLKRQRRKLYQDWYQKQADKKVESFLKKNKN